MTGGRFRFGEFTLDLDDRRLRRGDEALELNARYFDALALLVRERGRLVTKERFLDEVWRGVPVTDEALTQCVRTLRRRLGDDAVRPRFIETAPKHGYRFVAAVDALEPEVAGASPVFPDPEPSGSGRSRRATATRTAAAATAGGAAAGAAIGLVYGLVGTSGGGAVSALLVMVLLGAALGATAAAGLGVGIAAAAPEAGARPFRSVLGGAVGGLVVGGVGELVGLDAFGLLFGRSPADMTGALEGLLTGAALGGAVWVVRRRRGSARLGAAVGAAAGGAAGILIGLLGGRLFGGSLDLLGRKFPDARYRLEALGALFGEDGFGTTTRIATGGLEGLVFGAGFVAAAAWAARRDR